MLYDYSKLIRYLEHIWSNQIQTALLVLRRLHHLIFHAHNSTRRLLVWPRYRSYCSDNVRYFAIHNRSLLCSSPSGSPRFPSGFRSPWLIRLLLEKEERSYHWLSGRSFWKNGIPLHLGSHLLYLICR